MSNTRKYYWRTSCVIRETNEAVTIIFDPGHSIFSYKPGQFINLSLIINGKKITRSYSLSSVPDEDEYPSITIKAVDNGLVSRYIVNHADEINEWEVDGPHGFFYPDENAISKKQVVLIGGGSGITPLFSQLKFYLKHTSNHVLLIYTNRQQSDIIFSKSLQYLEKSYSHRLKIWYVFSGDEKDLSLFENHLEGRLSKLVLKKLLKKELNEQVTDTAYFICGPEGLIDLTDETLNSLGVTPGNIYKEYFNPTLKEDNSFIMPNETMEVLFHHIEQTNLLEVKPGQTILEAALENRIPVSYSCKNGTCGTCIAKVLEGEVHMANNFVLKPEHLDMNYVLLCQSYALNNEVTVETARLG